MSKPTVKAIKNQTLRNPGHGKPPRSLEWSYIRRALLDAIGDKIVAGEADTRTVRAAKNARAWIRNPNAGNPSLYEILDSMGANLSVVTVQQTMDKMIEEEGDILKNQ